MADHTNSPVENLKWLSFAPPRPARGAAHFLIRPPGLTIQFYVWLTIESEVPGKVRRTRFPNPSHFPCVTHKFLTNFNWQPKSGLCQLAHWVPLLPISGIFGLAHWLLLVPRMFVLAPGCCSELAAAPGTLRTRSGGAQPSCLGFLTANLFLAADHWVVA